MANDTVQITTFLLHGDWWFAGFMSFFVLLSLLITVGLMSKESSLERFDPLGEARLSLARRVPTKAWELMLSCERVVEAPGTGLIGPYGAALLQLTPLQAASCLYGLLSSAKAMAEGRLQAEAGGFRKEVVGVARRFFCSLRCCISDRHRRKGSRIIGVLCSCAGSTVQGRTQEAARRM